jgi:hypothetical protein
MTGSKLPFPWMFVAPPITQAASASRTGFGVRVIKVFDAQWLGIIDGTGALSTASARLLRNRRFRVD